MGRTVIAIKQSGEHRQQLGTFPLGQAGEGAMERESRWAERLDHFDNLGATGYRIMNGNETAVGYRGAATFRAMLLFDVEASYGLRIDGTRVRNGWSSPLLSPTRLASGEVLNPEDISIWHIELPHATSPTEDFTWWEKHLKEKIFERYQVSFARVSGSKATFRIEWGAGKKWGSWLEDWELEANPTSKFVKRAKVADRDMPFRTALRKDEVTLALIHHSLQGETLYDGRVLVEKADYDKWVEATPQGIDLGPDGDAIAEFDKETEEKGKALQEVMAASYHAQRREQRKRLVTVVNMRRKLMQEGRVKDAKMTRIGNVRIQLPRGVKVAFPDGRVVEGGGAQIKGDLYTVEGLTDQYGNKCTILTSPANIKEDVGGGDYWLIGIQPKHVKYGVRTSTQKIANLPALYPFEEMVDWSSQEIRKIIMSLIGGRLEEAHRLAAEAEDAALQDLDQESAFVLKRFRQYLEELIRTKHDTRHGPQLAIQAYRALVKRMINVEDCRINIPVPYSLYIPILTKSMMRLAKYDSPVQRGQIDVRPDLGFAVVTDEDWRENLPNWGGPDGDDAWNLILRRKPNGELTCVCVRDPNAVGEYACLTPLSRDAWRLEYRIELIQGKLVKSQTQMPVPTLDPTQLPKRFSDRLKDGDVVIERPDDLKASRSYPDGYQPSHFWDDLRHAILGDGPGRFINGLMGEAMMGIERKKILCTIEEAIDAFTQSGARAAKACINEAADEMTLRMVKTALAGPRKVDGVFWITKGFRVPENMDVPLAAILERPEAPGTLTHLMLRVVGIGEESVQHWRKKKALKAYLGELWGKEDSLMHGGEAYLRKHLLQWFEAPPGLRRPEVQKALKGSAADYCNGGMRDAWEAFQARASRKNREAYVAAALTYKERWGAAGLVARMSHNGKQGWLPADSMVWNVGVAEHVLAWLADNPPSLTDRVLYRVCVYQPELAAAYLNDMANASLAGCEDAQELHDLIDVLDRYAEGEKVMSAFLAGCVKKGLLAPRASNEGANKTLIDHLYVEFKKDAMRAKVKEVLSLANDLSMKGKVPASVPTVPATVSVQPEARQDVELSEVHGRPTQTQRQDVELSQPTDGRKEAVSIVDETLAKIKEEALKDVKDLHSGKIPEDWCYSPGDEEERVMVKRLMDGKATPQDVLDFFEPLVFNCLPHEMLMTEDEEREIKRRAYAGILRLLNSPRN